MADAGKIKSVRLSRRLQTLADLVTPGNVAADVGCDHGLLSVYLVEAGISPRVIASDVRKGPLSAAEAHIAERGLSAYIETRLSDGLAAYRPGEADTLVCAGMGGRLMQRILTRGGDVAMGFRELILQPQSELWQFRVFLRKRGFGILDEELLCEEGKYYFCFRVKPGRETGESPRRKEKLGREESSWDGETEADRLGDKYGAGLLRTRHPVLKEYLEKTLAGRETIRETLLANRGRGLNNSRLERSLSENEAEMADLRAALQLYEGARRRDET